MDMDSTPDIDHHLRVNRLSLPGLPILLLLAVSLGCQPEHSTADAGTDGGRLTDDAGSFPPGGVPVCDVTPTGPCALPGSWIHDPRVTNDDPKVCYVAGAAKTPDYRWLHVPEGFCVHPYGTVANARQLRFAPNGDLFVASPTAGTTGGGNHGLKSIVVLPDDNHDGYADSVVTFKDNLPSTQGMMFANGYFYYQDDKAILREPYAAGQRAHGDTPEAVATLTRYYSALHWPKTLDISDTGDIFVGNGGDQNEVCEEPDGHATGMPFHGGILKLDGTEGGNPIVRGLRNPIDVKCHRDGHNLCFATELALDYSASKHGREKLIPIRANDNWGFPCCAAQNLAYDGVSVPCFGNPSQSCAPECSSVVPENVSFVIGDTPFGFDFIDTQFPSAWNHKVYVALHGAAGSWFGARVVAIDMDPATGLPLEGSDIDGPNSGHMVDFAIGWDDGHQDHGRPSDITISSDGRMFIANDNNGEIFWLAPVTTP
jgi:glucose/arabinose dehydrogenase